MNKRLLTLVIVPALLSGCASTQSEKEVTIEKFYEGFLGYNWTATNNLGVFEYLSKNAVLVSYKDNPGVSGGYIHNTQGVFEYVITNNQVEVEGMVSPNNQLQVYQFMHSPADLCYISADLWIKKDKGQYKIDVSKLTQNDIDYLHNGLSIYNITDSFREFRSVTLSLSVKEARIRATYKDNTGERNTVTSITNIGKTKNAIVEDYLNSTPIIPKLTDWTSIQKQNFRDYEIPDPHFYSGYTEGLYLYLGYLNNYGTIIAYDSKSNASHVASLTQELLDNDYTQVSDGDIKKFEKNNKTIGVNFKIEFAYLTVDQLEKPEDKICYPSGYLQVVYRFERAYDVLTLSELNALFTECTIRSLTDPSSLIKKIRATDYTDEYNSVVEEVLTEAGVTFTSPAVYKELYIQISIDDRNDAHQYAYSIYEQILKDEFESEAAAYEHLCGREYTGDDPDVSIEEVDTGDLRGYSITGAKPYNDIGIIIVQVYDYDYASTGTVSILVEIFSKEAFEML